MTHKIHRPRIIASLREDILAAMDFSPAYYTEFQQACCQALVKYFRRIEKEYKIPCPICPKHNKRKK
jgi:hypothetical protein